MADPHKEKRERAGITAMSKHEADAQLLREKTARLRALRLAHEAANGAASSAAAPIGRSTTKKKTGKTREKAPSLSDWLATQQNQGRRDRKSVV
jgi:hypothetical protein